ncbi:hypothetical protein Nepgr_010898 [Nepenthes gracilis]|uniref:Uncharacterized protein n=1 Tax=Nepenthes gracilis TaxID=150966 RepID=A0AAD3XLG1_NEPGR|nr:hypothetical protein Nepgr_010898 [Nepenthes gracilis]
MNARMEQMTQEIQSLRKEVGRQKPDAHSSATHVPASMENRRKKKLTVHIQEKVFSRERDEGRSRLEGRLGPRSVEDSPERRNPPSERRHLDQEEASSNLPPDGRSKRPHRSEAPEELRVYLNAKNFQHHQTEAPEELRTYLNAKNVKHLRSEAHEELRTYLNSCCASERRKIRKDVGLSFRRKI